MTWYQQIGLRLAKIIDFENIDSTSTDCQTCLPVTTFKGDQREIYEQLLSLTIDQRLLFDIDLISSESMTMKKKKARSNPLMIRMIKAESKWNERRQKKAFLFPCWNEQNVVVCWPLVFIKSYFPIFLSQVAATTVGVSIFVLSSIPARLVGFSWV